MTRTLRTLVVLGLSLAAAVAKSAEPPVIKVEGQPLAAQVKRVIDALELLGTPIPAETLKELQPAIDSMDAPRIQKNIDKQVMFVVDDNGDGKVSAVSGLEKPMIQQGGFTPTLVKVLNRPGSKRDRLWIQSPQAGAVYSGASRFSLERQQQTELNAWENKEGRTDRFLALEMFTAQPLAATLSGLEVEYVIALLYSHEAGKREATLAFQLFDDRVPGASPRVGELKVALDVKPAVPVKLKIRDVDGKPTIARLIFRDKQGHIYPLQAKRLAPDLFFQPQVYRADGETVLLPPGEFTLSYSRGPEYRVLTKMVTVKPNSAEPLDLLLERWVKPTDYGFYSGDHHIHAAGCAHYTSPTEGIKPEDMFRQVKGEGLNVGCVLTWGPCYRYQRQFFEEKPLTISEPLTLLKYDLEISGFGSQSLGHVCLLNLKDQTYPGSDGTETKGWPTWTTPVMRWCKEQGGVTGYAHSASGMAIDPANAAARLLAKNDANKDGKLDLGETASGLLTEPFERTDVDKDKFLSLAELASAHDRAADQLPNLAIPEMNGVGAMEAPVSVAEGVCDFISAMDTERIQEWNTWYHLMNCGFPVKASGETDFPCMSSRNVGQGRVYVRPAPSGAPIFDLRDLALSYRGWCDGIRLGRSYVSDGYAHPLEFTVETTTPGDGKVHLDAPAKIKVAGKVIFAPATPKAVSTGLLSSKEGRRVQGDTRILHVPREDDEMIPGGERTVELVVNGLPVASQTIPADGKPHDIAWEIPIKRSSWVALRHFPEFHTNPVNVIVAGEPIRASRASAVWCQDVIDLLWKNRERQIAEPERAAAKEAFTRAKERYQKIAKECPEGS
jgi:hypothetical protein